MRWSIVAAVCVLSTSVPCWSQHVCHPCSNRNHAHQMCQNGSARKIVDESGLCGHLCTGKFCGHQIGQNASSCSLSSGPDCSAGGRKWTGGDLSCISTIEPTCGCSGEPEGSHLSGDASLSDSIAITVYPWTCGCVTPESFVPALDIRIKYTGWKSYGFSVPSAHICRQFRVAPGLRSSTWLQYDCPFFFPRDECTVFDLYTCAGGLRTHYIFRLPYLRNIVPTSLVEWEPLILQHAHRTDRLVYSVQRPPADICRPDIYHVQLGSCHQSTECSQYEIVPDTQRRMLFDCDSTWPGADNVRVEYDHPSESGEYVLLLYRPNGSAVVSVPRPFVRHSLAWITSVVAFVLVFLLFVGVVYLLLRTMKFRNRKLDVVEVLVLYNSETNLVHRLVSCLEEHCRFKCRLDVTDIPQTMCKDPMDWLCSSIDRCQNVLVLWFPQTDAPPIYRFFDAAICQLATRAKQKTVTVGVRKGSSAVPCELRPFRRLELPDQLSALVAACRGAPGSRQLTRRLLASDDGRQLLQLLRQPPGSAPAQQPSTPSSASVAGDADTQLLAPAAPLRLPKLLLDAAPSAAALVDGVPDQLPVPPARQPPTLDIVWH